MGKQRKTWSPELQEQIVLAVLRGEQPVAELARPHGVVESLIHNWRTQFLEACRARLLGDHADQGVKALEEENERLNSLLDQKELSLYIAPARGR